MSCVLFDAYGYHMGLCNESCSSIYLSGWPAVLHGKNFDIGYYMQTVTVQPNLIIPAICIGSIDLFHFILLLQTLTLPWGHKINVKQNLLPSFLAHFSSDQNKI